MPFASGRKGAAAAIGLLLSWLVAPPAFAKPGFSSEGAVACLECHETPQVLGILETAHANLDDPDTPAAQHQCQSCHGPSKVHMQFPMQVENLHFGKTSKAQPQEQNRACLECHESGKARRWEASAHGFEKLVCSTCHNIHSPDNVVLSTEKVVETCTSGGCHENVMPAAGPSDFSHRIGQDLGGKGVLVCSDCHDPHGPLSSGRCGDCHEQGPESLAKQSEKAQRYHAVATARGTECMRCHRGIAHPLSDDVLEASRREQERHAP